MTLYPAVYKLTSTGNTIGTRTNNIINAEITAASVYRHNDINTLIH